MQKAVFITLAVSLFIVLLTSCGVTEPCPNYSGKTTSSINHS